MAFAPIEEILEEIRQGRMVVIVDDEDRENEGDLIMAAELVTPQDINFMVTHARGLVCLSLTRERCRQLGLPPMVQDNTSQHHTNFTVSIEAAEGVTTGISAYDRAHTIRTAVKPNAAPDDLSQPGHIFPLTARPGGVLTRAGHTEAASDLALMAGLEPAGVLVEILNDDGSMARRPELEKFAEKHGLKIGSIEQLIQHRLHNEHTVDRVEQREIETRHGPFDLHVFKDRVSDKLHFALARGPIDKDTPTLVRVQTANLLSDALHWQRPDFGTDTADILQRIATEGAGILVVLTEDLSTDELLARIGSADATARSPLQEWRSTGVGSQILSALGAGQIRVIGTPRKQIGTGGFGLHITEYVQL